MGAIKERSKEEILRDTKERERERESSQDNKEKPVT